MNNNGKEKNGKGNNSNNGSNAKNDSTSIPSIVSLQQLEELASKASAPAPPEEINPLPPNHSPRYTPKFDQPVILKQSRTWSRAILWGLMGVTAGTLIWANIATIEEAVSATGKLEASGATKEVQAPVGGVVKEIFVEDGQTVKAGQQLLSLDSTTAKAQLDSFFQIRTSLIQENQFYKSQLALSSLQDVSTLKIPSSMLDLTKSRATLIADNQVYRALVNGRRNNISLTLEQQERLQSNVAELNARIVAAQSEIEQFQRQLQQADIKLASNLENNQMNQGILNDVTPLMKDGAISRIQYFKQQQEVRNTQSEIDQLTQEKSRLHSAISQAKAKLINTIALSRRDWLNTIAENNKKIAEIDSQLTKAIVENNKRIAEIDSQISQTQMNLKYQNIVAPVDGTIFEMKAHTKGFVVTSSEPILKVVPNNALIAKVYITNKDIGFVRQGMIVDVRIDSFPFSEFGDIKGKLIWIGSDALPPDQIYPFYRFPAKVQLDSQQLSVSGRNITLQSGMGVSTNIKVRERKVISIFTDMFSSSVDSLKNVR
ncbi:HlyD family type I secretion periplasmic adaptor subunit [Nostoc sp. FACHB-145]|uniref:HlyD family type I secretion periplasmic adaptor subunit n=1 Tax=Nostoc sp. FACHB-145 TaxID=2692836 RepID=UPI00168A037F|nr:HlyD family type I secretion periplasmic adaptor subunit [Nostoc sp. FACHB-145]MBD2468816.1 HlyD family type I secretion periplasmic adaptor subunit [Nostoc sp. FACHB-145]